jgi:hypothetical protein
MATTLRILLAILGASAIAIGLSIVFLGAAPAAQNAEVIYNLIAGTHAPLTGAWPATMDGELRFYAPFWVAYGILLLLAARDLSQWLHRIPVLAAVFFAGGVGRALSLLAVGKPHPVFIVLMAIELVLPAIYVLLWLRLRDSGQVS